MKINLAKSAGFCFGVKRALEIALKTAGSKQTVYMLGDIVHNEEVIKEIKKSGIKKIGRLAAGKNKNLLIRAHGTSLNTIHQAYRLGYNIIDATCPMVKEIHKIAKGMEQKGYQIIIIGDRNHDEVRGIFGQLKTKAVVIDPAFVSEHSLRALQGIKKACVVVQSTQDAQKVNEIVEGLKNYIRKLEFFNTICRPTRLKQEEIKILPLMNDVMIIIGSKTSANTKRLYQISKALNKKSYWVSRKTEIKPQWFKGAKNVGITAGASTPDSTTQEIIEYIRRVS